MRTRFPLLGLYVVLAAWVFTPHAHAQECTIGIYGDDAGLISHVGNPVGDVHQPIYELDVYYVVRAEAFILGVAWNREFVNFMGWGLELVASEAIWQPYATFLEQREEGYRIGLGECRIGYGGNAITIMQERLFLSEGYLAPESISRSNAAVQASSPYVIAQLNVLPNVLQDSEIPVISDCAGVLSPCAVGASLTIWAGVPTEGTSFSRMKAMFR